MNILMVSPQFKPITGGYERAAERLSKGLASRGHQVMVLAERRSQSWPYHERDGGVELRRWWCCYRRRLHQASSLFGFLVLLLRHGHRFDVWHVHQYGSHAALAIAIGAICRTPVVLKLTSTRAQGISAAISHGWIAPLVVALHKRARAAVVLSQEMFQEAVALGIPASSVHLLGNGIDTSLFAPPTAAERATLRAQLGVGDGSHAMFVGRLSAVKNVPLLLRAWSLAVPRLTNQWRLHIIGDGPEHERLVAEAQGFGVSESVVFHGHQECVSDWFAVADLFLQSSDNEGLSNTMLEALATGVPVVCTHVSGTEECVREPDTGLVVPVGDAVCLANAIVELANDDARRAQMSQRAVTFVRERYSIDRVCGLHEELYRSLIAQGRRE